MDRVRLMRSPVHQVALATLVCAAAAVAIEASPHRKHVERIADFIEYNYFDAARGREVAGDLRRTARSGELEGFSEPRELASALTERLRKVDRHFAVVWAGPDADASRRAAPRSGGLGPPERQGAFGFRRVELLPGDIGYIDLRTFADFDTGRADEPARRAADAALQLIANADAVIFDLRDNAGGSSAMAGYLVSAFTPPDADIYNTVHTRDGASSERPRLLHPQPRLEVPLYVLSSRRTGSAAESMAYTLQAARRAVIVGERSVGAANPGGMFPVGDGFNVFVSTGTPVSPVTGTNWEGKGVKPDIAVPSEEALHRAQLVALETVLAIRGDAASRETLWTLEALRVERTPQPVARPADYTGQYGNTSIAARNGELFLRQGERPAWKLIRLRGEIFFVEGEPSRRVVFERDAARRVTGFDIRFSSGRSNWFSRESP